jgi:hypothetical protein
MKQIYNLLFKSLLCLSCCAATIGIASAQTSYIDATGATQTATATPLTGSETTLTTGWYSIPSSVASFSARLVISGDVKIILEDGCDVTITGGISVNSGNSLTLYSQSLGASMGKLTARANDTPGTNNAHGDAGIGGDGESATDGHDCGTVIINGGYIIAYGPNRSNEISFNGAGIGGGGGANGAKGGTGGTIIINNGKVEAYGGDDGAGIGGGCQNNGGTITINNGEVYAEGCHGGAGIGGGQSGDGGTITINGGSVTAVGGSGSWGGGAGIGGGGAGGKGGQITIADGTVNATGGGSNDFAGGAGIGGGAGYPWTTAGSGGQISISGGTVDATGAQGSSGSGAGIGGAGGYSAGGAGGDIEISGGTVTAQGASSSNSVGAPAIGGGQQNSGNNGSPADLTLNGNAVVYVNSGGTTNAIDDPSLSTPNGIVFDGDNGTVYGNVTLEDDLTLTSAQILTVPDGSTLNDGGNTITNNGTIYVDAGGTVVETTPGALTLDKELVSSWFTITSTHTYNGASQSGFTASCTESGISSGDYSFSSASINAGSATVTITYTGSGHYYGSCDVTFTIAQAILTWTAGTVDNKYYDGATTATIVTAPTLTGIINGDDVTVAAGGAATFSAKDAGTGITVTATAGTWTLSGTAASNYTTSATNPTFAAANINAKQLSWDTNGTVSDKTYDGTTTATIATMPTLLGVVGTEAVTVASTAAASFSDKNASTTGKTVTATAGTWTLTGADYGSNYTAPTSDPVFADANINVKQLTWNNDGTVVSRAYDGTTNATVANNPTLNGVLSADVSNVTFTVGTAAFAAPDAASSVSITATGWGSPLSGSEAGNYAAPTAQPTFINATIIPVSVTILPTAGQSKTYNDADPTLAYTTTPSSLVAGNTITGALERATGENVGTYNITIGTLACSTNNYYLVLSSSPVTFAINPLPVGVTWYPNAIVSDFYWEWNGVLHKPTASYEDVLGATITIPTGSVTVAAVSTIPAGGVAGVAVGYHEAQAASPDPNYTFTTATAKKEYRIIDVPDIEMFDMTGDSVVYNGSPQAVTVTVNANFLNAPASYGNVPMTVKYNGSTTAPTAPGRYAVTVTVPLYGLYKAGTVALGDLIIGEYQRGLTATPTSLDFGYRSEGYTLSNTPQPVTVSLANLGVEKVAGLSFELSSVKARNEANAAGTSYEGGTGFANVVATQSGNSVIEPFADDEIIINVLPDLSPDTYRDTLIITDAVKGDVVARIPLEFKVYSVVPPVINRGVYLPHTDFASFSLHEGLHYVSSSSNFEFTVTAASGYDLTALKVTTGTWRDNTPGYIEIVKYDADGNVVTQSGNGVAVVSARVRILYINEDITLSLSGIAPVGNAAVVGKTPLKAWTVGYTLHIGGIPQGESFEVYSLTGVLLHSAQATGNTVQQVRLPSSGAYIVKTHNQSLKVLLR